MINAKNCLEEWQLCIEKECAGNPAHLVYVHIPFCKQKCLYCDFLSACYAEDTVEKYFKQLEVEIMNADPKYKEQPVESIFFGGGTPSFPAAEQVCRILERIKGEFRVLDEAEISLECNPGTIDVLKLRQYKKAGFNRISIGLQSAQNKELREIGRVHTYEEFLEGFQSARDAGFLNINVDLMTALPGQSLESYEETVRKVVGLNPEHISAYSLIIEEGTEFWNRYHGKPKSGFPSLPEEETERKMYQRTKEILLENGYYRYEISNYAKPGRECHHNSGYWKRKNYLGFGLGSASLYENKRWNNTELMSQYLLGNIQEKQCQIQQLTIEEQMEEFMFLGLRLMSGISIEDFKQCFHKSIEEVYGRQIAKLRKDGLLEMEGDFLRLTEKGIDLSNYALADFLF